MVTFYTFFAMIPKGKHPISVCMGTVCRVRGSEKLPEEVKRILGIEAGEELGDFLDFANAAGSTCATKTGAIPALPTTEEIEACRKSVPLLHV